jgi:DNA-3-methyladenine glycosylase I
MSKALKKAGFNFVGSTTMYAFMQATGMVDDHSAECFKSQNSNSKPQVRVKS